LDDWTKVVEPRKPNDLKIYTSSDNAAISTVYRNLSDANRKSDPSILYRITYLKAGMADQNERESTIGTLVTHLAVFDR